MFNPTKIITSLFGEVGFDDPLNPEYAIVDDDNKEARSGRKFTDNDLVKIELLYDNQDYANASPANFNTYLKRLQEKSIITVCDRVFDQSDYIDRQMLYQFANNPIEVDVLPDGFVGYKIEKSLEKNVAFEISRVILEFQGAGSIDLYLFQSNRKEHLFTKQVTISSTHQVEELNWRVDNTTVYEGEYYFGYFTDGLSVEPIKREYENANIMSLITHLNINRMQFTSANSPYLPDLENDEYTHETWGLNPDITVFNDYTDLIIQNKQLLAYAIQLQGQVYALQNILASIRTNANEQISKDMLNNIAVELDGINTEGFSKVGLKKELLGQINRIRKELFRLRDGYFASGFQMNIMS